MAKFCPKCHSFKPMNVIPSRTQDGSLKLLGWYCEDCGTTTTLDGTIIYGSCIYCGHDVVQSSLLVEEGVEITISGYVCTGCGLFYATPPAKVLLGKNQQGTIQNHFVNLRFRDSIEQIEEFQRVALEIKKAKQWQLVGPNGKKIATFDGRKRIQAAITDWFKNELSDSEVLSFIIRTKNNKVVGADLVVMVSVEYE